MNEIRVSSWGELNERLYEESWYQPHGRFRSPYAFRGLPDYRYDRRTSLNRLGGRYAQVEDDLQRNFRKYASRLANPRETALSDSYWNWLAMGQHHGLPTRLLDWTFSPYVALHFMTAKAELFPIDGVIWCIDFIKLRRFLPPGLKLILKRDGAVFFSADMLDQYARSLEDYDERVKSELPSGEACVIFFEPPSLDDRMVNQAALFSMMSSPTQQLEDWLQVHEAEQPGIFRKIIVPAVLKWEVRDKLDIANTTERVMFPGLDGLAAWMRRYYSPNHLIEIRYSPREEDRYLARIQDVRDLRMTVQLFRGEQPVREVHLTSRAGSQWWDESSQLPIEVLPRPIRFDFIPD
ncbi:FRG domain-containing protein [Bryobacter aggregatus]|uniref:FRG domain-containing protein n=1 Tax=Bryobacter aggregatus TaxID=360054 RepID=UPI0009B5CCAB|nr:FRG domain-containing protein [Bryobacter aggregatus]